MAEHLGVDRGIGRCVKAEAWTRLTRSPPRSCAGSQKPGALARADDAVEVALVRARELGEPPQHPAAGGCQRQPIAAAVAPLRVRRTRPRRTRSASSGVRVDLSRSLARLSAVWLMPGFLPISSSVAKRPGAHRYPSTVREGLERGGLRDAQVEADPAVERTVFDGLGARAGVRSAGALGRLGSALCQFPSRHSFDDLSSKIRLFHHIPERLRSPRHSSHRCLTVIV